jgi:hypothetical protein
MHAAQACNIHGMNTNTTSTFAVLDPQPEEPITEPALSLN